MPGIAHKDLTDPQLHEPKGASTAPSGSTLFADGIGGTLWKSIEISDLDFTAETVTEAPESAVTDASTMSTAGMSATTDGTIADAANFTLTNKNIKELATAYNNLVGKFNALLDEHEGLIVTVNALITSLQSEGLIQ